MADEFNTTTSHSEMIPEIWADLIQLAYDNHTQNGAIAVAANVTSMMPGGGDILRIPRQSAVTLESRTEGTALEYAQFSASEKTLTINSHEGVVIPVTNLSRAMAKQELATPLIAQIGAAASKGLDAAICGLYGSAGLTVTGTTGADILEANLREAKRKLDDAKAPRAGRWVLVNSQQEDALTGITRFSETQTVGSGAPITSGRPLGTLHGFSVYVSQNIVETTDGFAHNLAGVMAGPTESSIQYAYSPWAPMLSNTRSIDVNDIGLRLTVDYDSKQACEVIGAEQNYGVASFRSEWLVDVKTAN